MQYQDRDINSGRNLCTYFRFDSYPKNVHYGKKMLSRTQSRIMCYFLIVMCLHSFNQEHFLSLYWSQRWHVRSRGKLLENIPQLGFVWCVLMTGFKLLIIGRDTMEEILCSSCIRSGGMSIGWCHYWFVRLAKVGSVDAPHGKVTIFPFKN